MEEHIQEEKAMGYRACFKSLGQWVASLLRTVPYSEKQKQEASWRPEHRQATLQSITQYLETNEGIPKVIPFCNFYVKV